MPMLKLVSFVVHSPTRPGVKYFYVHPLSSVLLTLIALGLFVVYWFYKNWAAIKKAERTSIHPFGRAFFYQYFCFSLFTRIYGDAKAYGYKSRLTARKLIMFYIFGSVFLGVAARMFQNIMFSPLFFVLTIVMGGIGTLLALLPLLLIQPAIRFYNLHATQAAKQKKSAQVT